MTEKQLYMSAPYVLSTGSWLQFSFGRKSCSQIVAVGGEFWAFRPLQYVLWNDRQIQKKSAITRSSYGAYVFPEESLNVFFRVPPAEREANEPTLSISLYINSLLS